jgi:hypothetical protein
MTINIIQWFKKWRANRRAAIMFERAVVVRTDDIGISVVYPNGETQSIEWRNVERIVIETNDSGPWGADFWWLIEGNDSRCAYPGGATGDIEALKTFPKWFPGFSDEIVIKANGCTSNAKFICWERKNAL